MDYKKESLKKHYEWRGKISTVSKVPAENGEDLSLCYTPGVAAACMKIKENPDEQFSLTGRWNFVPVITDGTAVLGLGDIGAEAGMPVMEGKAALFKKFGGVDAIPLCIKSKDPDEIVRTIKLISGSFGGINLEDISAPRCFEIEKRLISELDIPVFHDDQHGTAIVVAAALINALKIVGKKFEDITAVINGAGAAGNAIGKFLLSFNIGDVIMCDKNGIICEGEKQMNSAHEELALITNKNKKKGSLKTAMEGADVFIGVSVPGAVKKEMVSSMAKNAIVFTLANPVPEIEREDAIEAGAAIVGTGSSAKPNQINNLLVFPGMFRGALDVRAKSINTEMMKAASVAIASYAQKSGISVDKILPYAYDKGAHIAVAKAVAKAAVSSLEARVLIDEESYLLNPDF